VLRLQQLGFTNAYALLGGIDAWRAATLPLEPVTDPTPPGH
jgi:rhodanese-related sulfurtransferase